MARKYFGTDGIRGLANVKITPELALKVGQAAGLIFQRGEGRHRVVIGKDKQLDLEKGEIGLHSTPTVVNDTVIVGSSMFEGLGYRYSTNAKGLARAFDVKVESGEALACGPYVAERFEVAVDGDYLVIDL